MRLRPLRTPLAATLPLLVALALGACGSGSGRAGAGGSGTPGPPPSTSELPPALAANARQANQIVGEGEGDFKKRVERLHGHPVVVNQWASWCPSCRAELGFFRSAVARHRARVAFLGLDSQDNRSDAEKFMKQVPPDFPSVLDVDASVAASIGGGQFWPSTVFLDKNGKVVQVKIGAYATGGQLDQDIRRYALGSG